MNDAQNAIRLCHVKCFLAFGKNPGLLPFNLCSLSRALAQLCQETLGLATRQLQILDLAGADTEMRIKNATSGVQGFRGTGVWENMMLLQGLIADLDTKLVQSCARLNLLQPGAQRGRTTLG